MGDFWESILEGHVWTIPKIISVIWSSLNISKDNL
jgi:hypothetical protein